MKTKCRFCAGEFIVADGCLPDMKKPERLEALGFMESAIFGVWHDWDGDGHWMMFDNSCGEYADGGVLIRYCPFCGRKLKGRRW